MIRWLEVEALGSQKPGTEFWTSCVTTEDFLGLFGPCIPRQSNENLIGFEFKFSMTLNERDE